MTFSSVRISRNAPALRPTLQSLGLVLWCLRLLSTAADDPALEPNKQVQVQEVVFDSALQDILYLGKQHECILVTTKSKRLYRSEDAGQHWTEITPLIEPSANIEMKVDKIIINNNDKTIAILQTKRRARASGALGGSAGKWYPYTFISEDSGKTWRKAWGKHHGLHSWSSHPTQRDWALVSWWTGNCDKDSFTGKPADEADDDDVKTDKEPCVHRLMFTKDLAKTFVQITTFLVQFSWGTAASGQSNRVYYTAHRSKNGDQGRMTLWTSEVDFYYCDISSSGRPSNTVEALKYGNKFLVSGEFVLVARVKNEATQTVNLMVSKDGAKTFAAALLPSGLGDMEEKWYTVLDTSEGAVMLHVNSNDEVGVKDAGRVYVSDSSGVKFSQSLANNVRSAKGECEFDKILSLAGVYLANVVVADQDATLGSEAADAAEEIESQASQGADTDKKHGRGFGKDLGSTTKEERRIRTVITFNKGGAWTFLRPPLVDSFGKQYACAGRPLEDCALHLHGTLSWDLYAPYYSSDNAVGLIMGTGNVGPTLRFEPEETNTYLSRDGGLTWMEAHKGAYIYEFGDHGGLIVMADDLKKTSQVVFTWNEGQTWFDFEVSKTAFEVDNILTEPNWTSTTFVIFGSREDGSGVLYYLKFDALNFPKCKGVWAADSVSSDYETWTPSDGVAAEKCMLGRQVTYTRRKKTSICWNGEDFERPTSKSTCQCTQEDFACDVGFTRKIESKECVFGGVELLPERLLPSVCASTFALDAYRKVSGDVCEGGWQPVQAQIPCPSQFSASTMRSFLGLMAVVGAMYLAYNKFFSNVGGRNTFGEFTAPSKSGLGGISLLGMVAGCLGWLQGKLSGTNRGGLDRFPDLTYKKLSGTEFDLDGITGANDDSLGDFIDDAEHDDFAPRVYGVDDKDRDRDRDSNIRREAPSVLAGGAREAVAPVPRLPAPSGAAGGAPQHFNASNGDEDLL